MDEEVLLDFKEAKTQKKIANRVSSCASKKTESPSRGNSKHGKNLQKLDVSHNVREHLFYIIYYLIIEISFL
jgi:hypothetical protein